MHLGLSIASHAGRTSSVGEQLWPPLLGSEIVGVRVAAQVVSFSLARPPPALILRKNNTRASPWGPQDSGTVWSDVFSFPPVNEKNYSGTCFKK